MRHLVAWVGAVAYTVWMWQGIRTSDSSTAAIGWLTVPPFVLWWFGCVYLGAAVWRRRREPEPNPSVGAPEIGLAALVGLPFVSLLLTLTDA